MDRLIKHLQSVPEPLCCYYLGLPLDSNAEDVQIALICLEQLGIADYVQQHIQQHSQRNTQPTWLNSEDVFLNPIAEYSVFDVLVYSDTVTHAFTRPEWKSMLQSKRHMYTMKDLPASILREMQERSELAELLRFPEAKPLLELLTELDQRVNPNLIKPNLKPIVNPNIIHVDLNGQKLIVSLNLNKDRLIVGVYRDFAPGQVQNAGDIVDQVTVDIRDAGKLFGLSGDISVELEYPGKIVTVKVDGKLLDITR